MSKPHPIRHLLRDIVVVLLSTWVVMKTVCLRLLRGPKHPGWGFVWELVVEVVRAVMRLGHEHMSVQMRRLQPTPPLTAGIARQVTLARTQVAGVPTETLTPMGWSDADPTWLHCHGGAYSMCSPATHRLLLARIALASGVRCIAPNYRKAPEHPYPAPIDDCYAVYRALLDEGVDNVVMAGDSAGGGLALAVLQRARADQLPMPVAGVLLSPWVDLTATSGGSVDTNRPYDYLQGEMLVSAVDDYLNGAEATHPQVSPVYADLAGLPPLLVQSGGAEIFLDQNRVLVERAREQGVQVVHEVSDGMVHVFQMFAPFGAAGAAIKSIGRYVAATVPVRAAAE